MPNLSDAGLVIAAHGIKARNVKYEEQAQKWREEETRRQEESQRRKLLEMQAEMWDRAQRIRNYAQECEEHIYQRVGDASPNNAES